MVKNKANSSKQSLSKQITKQRQRFSLTVGCLTYYSVVVPYLTMLEVWRLYSVDDGMINE
jgi:hypothetical protein